MFLIQLVIKLVFHSVFWSQLIFFPCKKTQKGNMYISKQKFHWKKKIQILIDFTYELWAERDRIKELPWKFTYYFCLRLVWIPKKLKRQNWKEIILLGFQKQCNLSWTTLTRPLLFVPVRKYVRDLLRVAVVHLWVDPR